MTVNGNLTISMFLLYKSLAPATAVRLLASAVAWTSKKREEARDLAKHSPTLGGREETTALVVTRWLTCSMDFG